MACVLEGNSAYYEGGGGIFLSNSSARIEGCQIRNNTVISSSHDGAGI